MTVPQRLIARIKDKDPLVKKLIKLPYMNINDKDVEELVNVLKDDDWGKLDLSGNNITAEGAKLLASIKIEELNLSQNSLGDEGAKHLLNSPTVKKMVLDDNGVLKQTLADRPYNNLKLTPKILDILYPSEKASTKFDLLEYEINNTAFLYTASMFKAPNHNYTNNKSNLFQQEQENLLKEQNEVNAILEKIEHDHKLKSLTNAYSTQNDQRFHSKTIKRSAATRRLNCSSITPP
ncbi:MAG: hypothetical protein K0S11_1663, partial [Gammaproteobacteria bacterium]|nr:hypothetical protein [Gammaproteobacteria bacterium]